MNELFDLWNYTEPQLPLIAQDLLSPITEYDNMLLSEWRYGIKHPEYNPTAHNVLINTFVFYCEKHDKGVAL